MNPSLKMERNLVVRYKKNVKKRGQGKGKPRVDSSLLDHVSDVIQNPQVSVHSCKIDHDIGHTLLSLCDANRATSFAQGTMAAHNFKATCNIIHDNLEDMQRHIEIIRQLLPKLFSQNLIVQTTCDESFPKDVAAQSSDGLSHRGKGEHTHECQGKIANSYTFVHANDNCVASSPLSVSCSLPICESIISLPLDNDVIVVSVDTLVVPIDDQIYPSCKIDLCPPNIETTVLNESTSSCEIYVDQLLCENCSTLEDVCDVINESQVCNDVENINQRNRSEPVSLPFGSNICLAYRDNYVFQTSLKLDNEHLESELTCSKSARGIDHALFSLYANPLWCDNIPPKDGNLFLQDESTLKGKECIVLLDNPKAKIPFGISSPAIQVHSLTVFLGSNCQFFAIHISFSMVEVVDQDTSAPRTINVGNPLYIHSSDSAGASLVPVRFDGVGYRSWRSGVLQYLSVKNKLGFINGEV
ncbi:hypothetical protein FXO37_02813 [Capsicum annuum]|nr:hypothetical protein FXO37_02813 [Capsicum annuum]